MIQKIAKMIQRFLGIDTYNTVYMGKLHDIQDFLSYIISLRQNSSLWIFTNSQTALQDLENLNGCSTPQIIQIIIKQIKDPKIKDKPVCLNWIPVHTNVKKNKKADVMAKKVTGWRRAKKMNKKKKK